MSEIDFSSYEAMRFFSQDEKNDFYLRILAMFKCYMTYDTFYKSIYFISMMTQRIKTPVADTTEGFLAFADENLDWLIYYVKKDSEYIEPPNNEYLRNFVIIMYETFWQAKLLARVRDTTKELGIYPLITATDIAFSITTHYDDVDNYEFAQIFGDFVRKTHYNKAIPDKND